MIPQANETPSGDGSLWSGKYSLIEEGLQEGRPGMSARLHSPDKREPSPLASIRAYARRLEIDAER